MTESNNDKDRVAHTTTTRGRKVYTPSRFTEAGTFAATLPHSYSIYDYHAETASTTTNEDTVVDELFETNTRPQVEYTVSRIPYGISISPKTHAEFMAILHEAIEQAATYSALPSLEAALVGATGPQFKNTNELHVLTYWEAMASDDKAKWLEAVEDEDQRLMKLKVFKPIPRNLLLRWAKVLSTVWACKRKANGVYRARLDLRGFEQIPDVHFRPEWIRCTGYKCNENKNHANYTTDENRVCTHY